MNNFNKFQYCGNFYLILQVKFQKHEKKMFFFNSFCVIFFRAGQDVFPV